MSSPLDHKHHKQTQQELNLHSSGSEPDAIPFSPCACIRKPSLRDSNAHFRVRSPVFSPFILREVKVPWRCRSAPYGFADHIHRRMERDIRILAGGIEPPISRISAGCTRRCTTPGKKVFRAELESGMVVHSTTGTEHCRRDSNSYVTA